MRVRSAIAEKLNTTIYILEKLTKDKNWRVRWEVAWNLNTPIYLLEKLTKSKKEIVRKTAQEKLKEITQ